MDQVKGALRSAAKLALALVVVGCGAAHHGRTKVASRRPTPDGVFRYEPPFASKAFHFEPPTPTFAQLTNGTPVLFVEDHTFPVAVVSLVTDVAPEAKGRSLADPYASTLFDGTPTMDELAIAQRFVREGVRHGAQCAALGCEAWVAALPESTETAVRIVAESLRDASFPDDRVRDDLADRIEALRRGRTRSVSLLWSVAQSMLYPPGHPYRNAVTIDDLEHIDRTMLLDYHRRAWVSDRTTVVVVGDVHPAALVDVLDASLAWMPKSASAWSPPPRAPRPEGVRTAIVDIGPAPLVSIGALWTVDVGDPIFFDAATAAYVIGGDLSQSLREKHGWTYGVSTYTTDAPGGGPFGFVTEVQIDHAGEAIREILATIDKRSKKRVSKAALQFMVAQRLERLQATFGTAASTAGWFVDRLTSHELPDGYFRRWTSALAQETSDRARLASSLALSRSNVTLVFVGDAKRLRPQLEGVDLGTVTDVDEKKTD